MLLLTVVAKNGWMLESANVASAFLQAIKDLDCENLLVQAPAELGTAFGGSGADDPTVLKLKRTFVWFVSCAQGPVWFDIVAATATLKKSGWRQLASLLLTSASWTSPAALWA